MVRSTSADISRRGFRLLAHATVRNVLMFLLALMLVSAACAATTEQPQQKEAYVTLLYGDFYVLPVRVMMRSLLMNSPDVSLGARERVVIVTGSTSERALKQLRDDGITVRTVPPVQSPYLNDAKYRDRFVNVMTKLYVFNMTDYASIVFVDADSLILHDMSPLHHCGNFCAVFINPCFFNSGLMHVTPNASLFADMQRELPKLPSYDGGDQGFLNEYFTELMDAPMFDYTAKKPDTLPPFARLPFSWHVDHSSFFPTFSFEFEKSDRCGPRRDIEWLGPPMAKPWLWWTYACFDLSWAWNSYRSQIRDPYPPRLGARRNGMLLVLGSYVTLAALLFSFMPRYISPVLFARILPRLCPFKELSPRFRCMVPILAGVVLWVCGFAYSAIMVPQVLPPLQATFVFLHLRVTCTLLVLLVGGFTFCLGQKNSGRSRPPTIVSGKQLHNAFREMLWWSIMDAFYLVVWVGISWQIRFPTMWAKGMFIAAVIYSQGALVVLMVTRTSLSWLKMADAAWVGEMPPRELCLN